MVKPIILLTDTDRRPYTARLALRLASSGCDVAAVVSSHHPVATTDVIRRIYKYSGIEPLRSLQNAIQRERPELVIPCCDRGVQDLHDLCRCADKLDASGYVRKVITKSLGAAESFPIVSSRYNFLQVAKEAGLRVPQTALVNGEKDIEEWSANGQYPGVLKSDGTWGGRGVRIVCNLEEAKKFYVEIRRTIGFRKAVKRLCVNKDPFWIRPWWRGSRPAVVIQSHIGGRPANCAVVCWKGKVLAGTAVEVLSMDGVIGPARVVRVVNNSEMMICAKRIAQRLDMSGFFGLDFMIENGTNDVYLIEINPRVTPLSHLCLGKGRDLVAALMTQVTGQQHEDGAPITNNPMIAYFPQAWTSPSELFSESFLDIPVGEPRLVKELLSPTPERSVLYRLINYLQTRDAFVHGHHKICQDASDEDIDVRSM